MAAHTTTATTVISSVSFVQVGDIQMTRWSDGSVTIENWRYPFTQDDTLEHVTLTREQAQALDDLLSEA